MYIKHVILVRSHRITFSSTSLLIKS